MFLHKAASRFALAAGLLAVAACQPPATPLEPSPGPSEVVEQFLSGYDGDFRAADPALLSPSLAEGIQAAAAIEKASAAAVLASEFPTEKPQLLEGEIFSGLYEGFTGWTITGENTNGEAATVEVAFTNSHYGVGWVDEIDLIEAGGWKIDDVRYLHKLTGARGLREVLGQFEQAAAQDPLLNPPQP